MNSTGTEAYEEVLKSTHDLPFNLGPFGEAFSFTKSCFIGSTSGLEVCSETNAVSFPMEGEAFVEVP